MKLLIKQMLRQWRPNLWLIIELSILTVVTWFIIDLLSQTYKPLKEPHGFDIERVYQVNIGNGGDVAPEYEGMSKDDMVAELLDRLARYPGVEAISHSRDGVQPFSGSMSLSSITDIDDDSVSYGGGSARGIRIGRVNPGYFRVFRVTGPRGETPEQLAELAERSSDWMMISPEVVAMRDSIVDGAPTDPYRLLGHRFLMSDRNYELVGVINQVKRNRYNMLDRYSLALAGADKPKPFSEIAIRVSPEADKGFAERLRSDFKKQFHVGRYYFNDVRPFSDLMHADEGKVNNTITRFTAIMVFLLANLFLGLLGTFWYRTRCRVPEIALRMSFGASRTSVFRSLIAEGFILLAVAVIIAAGLIWLIDYYEVNDMTVYSDDFLSLRDRILNALVTILSISLIVAAGIWIPARRAMRIEPAIALKDE
ncbi:MAG: FtsX-like permease family protein [Muribaculaceae bacterium]|nr:FtsX-like permease family protein [Muribaculaceae bacterium]